MQDIIKACRSYRRFDESDRIDRKLLTAWVDAARLVASSGNAQPLRYAIVSDERACERVFSCCAWAKALPDWPGPVPGERPSAYVVVCRDNDRTLADTFTAWDEGIAAQTIMLQAVEAGFGGCIIASFKKRSMAEALGVDADRFQPDLVLALGKPVEDVRIVDLPAGGATEYWRDEAGVHYVPCRACCCSPHPTHAVRASRAYASAASYAISRCASRRRLRKYTIQLTPMQARLIKYTAKTQFTEPDANFAAIPAM